MVRKFILCRLNRVDHASACRRNRRAERHSEEKLQIEGELDMLVLAEASLAEFKSTAHTAHTFGGRPVDTPAWLRLARFEGSADIYLLYLNANLEELTDTWHGSVESALRQAEAEFGVRREHWKFAEGDSGSGSGM